MPSDFCCGNTLGFVGVFAPRFALLFCTAFSKAVARAALAQETAFSFVIFSLGLFFQRKAAKWLWYLWLVPPTLATSCLKSTFSLRKYSPLFSCLTYVSHLLTQNRKRKSSQKEMGGMQDYSPRTPATFEKVDETIIG